MACKWTYKGKVYTEPQFIALMASGEYDALRNPNKGLGNSMIELGRKLDQMSIDYYNNAKNRFNLVPIPPQIIAAAGRIMAQTLIGGGKVYNAITKALQYIKQNVQGITDIELTAFRDAYKNISADMQANLIQQLNQGATSQQAINSLAFDSLEQNILDAQDRVEVLAIIENFFKTNKDRLKGLSSGRVIKLFGEAAKAQYKQDAIGFIRKAEAILNNQELERMIDKAEDLQKKLLKNTGVFTNKREDIIEFLNADPELLAQVGSALLAEYNSALEDLANRGVRGTEKALNLLPIAKFYQNSQARRLTGMNAVISAYTEVNELKDHINDLMTKVTTLEDLKQFAREVSMITTRAWELLNEARINNDPVKEQQFQDFIENEIPTMKGDNAASAALKAMADQFKEDTFNSVQGTNVSKSLNTGNKYYTEAVEKFTSWTKEQVMRLTPAQVLTYAAVMRELKQGYIPPQMHDLNNAIATQDVKTKLSEDIERDRGIVDNRSWAMNKLSKLMFNLKSSDTTARELGEKFMTEAKQYWDSMFGTGASKTFWKNILYDVSKGFVDSQKNYERDVKEFNDALFDLKNQATKTFLDADTDAYKKQVTKLGMILAQLDYQSNTPGWDLPEFANNQDYFQEVSNNPENIKTLSKEKLDLDKAAYKELEKAGAVVNGVLDPYKAMATLSAKEQRVMDAFQKMLDIEKEKGKFQTEKRGDPFIEQKNYFPRNVLSDFTDTEEADSFLRMVNASPNLAQSRRAASTLARTPGAINYWNMNLEQVGRRHARQMNQDMFLTDAVKQKLGALSQLANQYKEDGNPGRQTEILAIKQAVIDSLNEAFSAQFRASQADFKFIDAALSTQRNIMLSNPLRLVSEGAGNIIRTGGVPFIGDLDLKTYGEVIKSVTKMNANDMVWDEITDEMGSSVFLKGGRWAMEEVGKSETRLARFNNALMVYMDAVNAKNLWRRVFTEEFKKSTGTDFDASKWGDASYKQAFKQAIDNAAKIAELEVNQYYNSQTQFAAPSRTRVMPRRMAEAISMIPGLSKAKELGEARSKDIPVNKIMGFMNSFAANETMMMRMAIKNMADGNHQKALGQISRMMISNYVFALASMAAGTIVKAGFDDDEEILTALGDKFSDSGTYLDLMSLTAASSLLGRYSNLFRTSSAITLGLLNSSKPEDADEGMVDRVTEWMRDVMYIKPVMTTSDKRDPRATFENVMEGALPGAGNMITDVSEFALSAAQIAAAKMNEEEVMGSDVSQMQRMGLYTLTGMAKGVPMAAIGNRYLTQKISKQEYEENYDAAVEREKKKIKEDHPDLQKQVINKEAKRVVDRRYYRNELKRDKLSDQKIEEKMKEWDDKHPKNY